MTIRRFLFMVFGVLLLIGIYLHIQYLKGKSCQENTEPIEYYYIIDKHCSSTRSGSNSAEISYNGKIYWVSLPSPICYQSEQYIVGNLFYMESEDEIFYEDYYMPLPIVYLTYIVSVLLPLLGFVVYRKELDNHYKTM